MIELTVFATNRRGLYRMVEYCKKTYTLRNVKVDDKDLSFKADMGGGSISLLIDLKYRYPKSFEGGGSEVKA